MPGLSRCLFSALSSRMKAVSGNGSSVIARPTSSRSITIGVSGCHGREQRGARAGGGSHRPRSAMIRPEATASTRALWSRSFWSAYATANSLIAWSNTAPMRRDKRRWRSCPRSAHAPRQRPAAELAVHAQSRTGSGSRCRRSTSSPGAGGCRSRAACPSSPAAIRCQPRKMSLDACISRWPGDHPLALVGVLAGADEAAEHRRLGLLDLQEQRIGLVPAEHQGYPAPGADAADAHDLTGQVGEFELLEQVLPVGLQRAPVRADQAAELLS